MAKPAKSNQPTNSSDAAVGKFARSATATRGHLYRPPSFLSPKSLALELDIAENQMWKLVERGVLPKPTMLAGIPRFEWELVRMAISATVGGILIAEDAYMAGVRNATEAR